MSFRLDGRVAIITGAAQGIGAVYAKALAGEGAHVALADIHSIGRPIRQMAFKTIFPDRLQEQILQHLLIQGQTINLA